MGAGMVLGTLVGAGSIALGLSTLTHMSAIGVVILAAGLYACPRLLAGKADRTIGAKVRHLPTPSWRLAAIGAVILVSVIEGATLTWATLYMTRDLGTTAAFAAFAVTAHSLGTTVVQLSGDWFRRRYSAARITRVSVVVGGAVMAGALAAGNPWFALVGFFALGGGIAFVYPAGISAAADTQATPAPGVSVAQTVRYLAGFGAGPLVGVLVGAYGLTWTFYVAIAFGVTLTLLLGGFLGKEPGLGRRSGGDLPDIEAPEPEARPVADRTPDLAIRPELD
ncbi:MFS transporter [Nonomuraea thailandensis]